MINDFLLNLPLPLLDNWGYLFLFILTILEALPAVGNFIPGQTVVIFAGFLAYLGILRLDAAIVVSSLGAITGDIISYIIGRKYGHDFIARYGQYFFISAERFKKTKALVQEHAGKALIIGRFGPLTRTFSAFLAGVSKIKFYRFIFFAAAGGASWAAISVLIGYVFGQGFATAAKHFGWIILISFAAIILIVLGYNFLNKKKQVFLKRHGFYLFLNTLSVYVFSKMAGDYVNKESIYRLDLWIGEKIESVWQPGLNKLMILITDIFSPEVLFFAAAGGALYFIIKKQWEKTALILAATSGGLILGAIFKVLIKRPRPLGSLVLETGYSFPSQHALMALIFFSLAVFFFGQKIKNTFLRHLFVLGNVFLIILVGFSRVYLKVHWLSDVSAGLALGLFWLTFLILIFAAAAKLFRK